MPEPEDFQAAAFALPTLISELAEAVLESPGEAVYRQPYFEGDTSEETVAIGTALATLLGHSRANVDGTETYQEAVLIAPQARYDRERQAIEIPLEAALRDWLREASAKEEFFVWTPKAEFWEGKRDPSQAGYRQELEEFIQQQQLGG